MLFNSYVFLLRKTMLSAFLFLMAHATFGQTFPCDGSFLFTRQNGSGNSFISRVDFVPGDINITNPGLLSPATNTNASVFYGGYIWTQNWANATQFELLRVASTFTTTSYIVAGAGNPGAGTRNNAGVTKAGIMYILSNANPAQIWAINLSTGTPAVATGTWPKTVTGLGSVGATWGDIVVDPVTDRIYAWYHHATAPAAQVGLYEITNINTTPTLTAVGSSAVNLTLGSLFFNDRGQLFGYGSTTLGGVQDRIYAIDKATGRATQYGVPDLAVSQSDGSNCAFRVSMDCQVSSPFLSLLRCGVDTIGLTFTLRNYTLATQSNISFNDTLDTRLSYVFDPAALQTQLQTLFPGGVVAVSLTSDGGGTNNRLNITGIDLPMGANSFTLPVKVDANLFTVSATISEQAYLGGVPTSLGGPNEPSNEPSTFNPKDASPITITLTGSKCLPPIADNFTNLPMPQGANATAIPPITAADPDGIIVSYTITSLPAASQGILSVACPPNITGATCTGGYQNLTAAVLSANSGSIVLTPAQALTLRFDPASNNITEATFSFIATDNSGKTSNTAIYRLPVTGQPPIANNLVEASLVNTANATAILELNASDADGTITSYTITALPPSTEGVLSMPCPVTVAGATCTGGFQDLTAAVLTANSGSIPLTLTQAAGLRFDPLATFTGKSIFTYGAIDNSGYASNSATFTIPVVAASTLQRPPVANNITSAAINNNLSPTAIPALKAADIDGSITNYTITSLPPSSEGVVSVACPPNITGGTCTGGFTDLTAAVLTANSGAIVLTPTQVATLRFDPASGFTGNSTFTYFATDNSTLVSNVAIYTIPVVNTPPVAININTVAAYNGSTAAIIGLQGVDKDGTITEYRIKSVPSGVQGILSVSCPPTVSGATCTGGFQNLTSAVLTANASNISLTSAQAASLRFSPAANYSGTFSFTYTAIDNNGLESQVGVYTILIPNQPPVSVDITVPVMLNTAGTTAITQLSSSDADGTIASYTLYSVPLTHTGVLSVSCPAIPYTGSSCVAGRQDITPTVLTNYPDGLSLLPAQITSLQFDPGADFTGVVNFIYNATDNSGNNSNTANYNIPISGIGNLPPIANNIVNASMPNISAATAISPLVGSDPDGTVASFVLTTVPNAIQGVLSVSCPPNITGGTCTGGFTDLTAAVLAANPGGIVLTSTQATSLRFDPSANYSGNAVFNYYVVDNLGAISNVTSYTLPITGFAPYVAPIVTPAISQTAGPTAFAIAPVGFDADGTIVNYTIETLPPSSQGVISVACPPNITGGTCTGGFTDLTAAVLAANPNGIVLTASQITGLRFDPSGNYSGYVLFNYHATDNAGLNSNSTKYAIPVTGEPPLSRDVVSSKLVNNAAATTISSLTASDVDGTISTYIINSLPPSSQGVLSVSCPPNITGGACTGGFTDLTAAVLAANPGGIVLTSTQAASLRFDPSATYNGFVVMNYSSTDNNGNLSNLATYTIPVGTIAVLPLREITFSGLRNGNNIEVSWKSKEEVNVSHYEIEWSLDAINYKYGGKTMARNASENQYSFTLANYTAPLYYLRLRIEDVNGRVSHSNVITVRLLGKTSISILPNPVADRLQVSFGGTATGNYQLTLTDATGRTVKQILVREATPGRTITIERNGLPSGTYLLQAMPLIGGTAETFKLTFQ